MAIQSIDGKTTEFLGCPDGHRPHHPPMLFKPNSSVVRAASGCEILLNRRGSWLRTRPLPDPARTSSVGGLAMIPLSSTAAEHPLLSQHSADDQQQRHQIASTGEGGGGGGGIFDTFGTDYNSEQSIDLLRRSNSSAGSRPPPPPPIVVGVGPGATSGMSAAVRESGPYYFKLDLNDAGVRHSHHDGGVSPCFMCQAGTPRGPRPITVNQIQS